MSDRQMLRRWRVDRLIQDFGLYLDAYEQSPPFTRSGQWENHARTIERRRELSTVGAALDDDAFLESLWDTLRAWGIGVRASRLVPFSHFADTLRLWRIPLEHLEVVRLPKADTSVGGDLWLLIEEIDIVENEARIVALTKTIHHLLPDLLPPIDRAYTGTFFAWHVPEFQSNQREIFDSCWGSFIEIAQAVDLDSYVGTGPWNTSCSKVLDNAIVGFCLAEGLELGKGVSSKRSSRASTPRRDSWTIGQLQDDLDEFAAELDVAGLKPHTVETYVGRADAFIRWLDGRYEPRGPNRGG